jgi:L,D-peptidoglycan transpeptidase YkuD (ErfK/YbiS/YcfS/YnhG family)
MIIHVWPEQNSHDGHLKWPARTVRCALGRSGIGAQKSEGDGITPAGQFPLRRVFYRPDRLAKPQTNLPVLPLRPDMGWCDAPLHAAYNTLITRPFSARHERLWRADRVYDVIVELGYNDNPIVPGRGSAIFLHVARKQYQPTEGCVAINRANLLSLLRQCGEETTIMIGRQCSGS